MVCVRFFLYSVMTVWLVACGTQVANNDVPEPPSLVFRFFSPSLLADDSAPNFMVFDIAAALNTSNGAVEILTPTPFFEQQENITNPEIRVTATPGEATAYAFFVEGVGDAVQTCEGRNNTNLNDPVLVERCLHWGILNVTFGGAGFFDFTIPSSLSTGLVATRGATLLSVPYLVTQGGTYDVTPNFAGIEPPATSFFRYNITGFALKRPINLNINPAANPNLSQESDALNIRTISEFQQVFGRRGFDLILAEWNDSFVVRGKIFAMENADGTYENEAILDNTVITCGGVAGAGDSPFDNPGYSPQLQWENAPTSTNSFALFMMDDSSLEQAGLYSSFLGPGDDLFGATRRETVQISETSESTQAASNAYTNDCDFEACRHWAVFNIPSSVRSIARNQDFSVFDGVVQGRHLYHGAYAVQQQPLLELQQYDVAVGETLTYTTNRGTLSITSDGATTTNDGVTRVATTGTPVNTTQAVSNATEHYFGPCAPVNSQSPVTARQYSITLLPVSSQVTDWIGAGDNYSRFIRRLSLNNFLYYFSTNQSDQRRKRPGCPLANSTNMDNCQDNDGNQHSSPYPNRATLLAELGGSVTVPYVIHAEGAINTFYHADDDCELCRFCLIGYDAATPQVPLDAWRQFGHTY